MQPYVDSPALQMRKLSTERSRCLPKVTQFIRDSISRQGQTVWASQPPAPGPIPKGATGRACISDPTPSQKGPRWKLFSGSPGMSPDNNGPAVGEEWVVEVVAGMCGDRGGRRRWGWTRPLAAIILPVERGEHKGPIRHLPKPGGE